MALAAADGRGRLVAIFHHTVNIDCAGWIVNIGADAPQSVCMAQVDSSSLESLFKTPIGSIVELSTCDNVIPVDLSQSLACIGSPNMWPLGENAVHAILEGSEGSWFDTDDGRMFGIPRLEAAGRALARWMRAAGNDPIDVTPRLEQSLEDLCGLGVGLTPAGDDAIIGMFAALCAAGIRIPPLPFITCTDGEILEKLTTDVSATSLRLAARGEFSLPIHVLFKAIAGEKQHDIAQAITNVRQWGATSGRDMLRGLGILAKCSQDKYIA
jgi:hypothetical protein